MKKIQGECKTACYFHIKTVEKEGQRIGANCIMGSPAAAEEQRNCIQVWVHLSEFHIKAPTVKRTHHNQTRPLGQAPNFQEQLASKI